MVLNQKYDLIIVGAGPGGLMAARTAETPSPIVTTAVAARATIGFRATKTPTRSMTGPAASVFTGQIEI